MSKLDDDELLVVSEIVECAFKDDPIKIVSHLDTINKLDEFLKITGLKHGAQRELECDLMKTKKVLVVGNGLASASEYKQRCRSLGISPDNFEFYLDFEDGARLNFEKYRYRTEYGGIIVGAMPHSGRSKGKYSSVVEYLEKKPGFPRVVKADDGGELKLTISSFSGAVLALFNAGALTIDK